MFFKIEVLIDDFCLVDVMAIFMWYSHKLQNEVCIVMYIYVKISQIISIYIRV